jgi:hypothetical protein
MQNLELTDTEAPALVALLKNAIADDRFPPPPARPLAAPPPKIYAPPTKVRYRRRG